MGAACWRRAHEYAALDGEPTESEQRMAVEELHAEIARLEQIRVRQEDDARHMTFMMRQLQATSGRKFHAFFLRHFAFELDDYLYQQEEDKGDQQEVQYGLQKITVREVGLADLE